jgi:LysR family transcriptional regulator, hca operon transcriptional activator
MELRHLRYFVAVVTVAAEKTLHTAQPSLSRQIRDLEYEVGVSLMNRSVHGIELTAAGRAFLDHARLALAQVEAAAAAARRAAHPGQRTLALGFLSGCEPEWLPGVMYVLRKELPEIEVTSPASTHRSSPMVSRPGSWTRLSCGPRKGTLISPIRS